MILFLNFAPIEFMGGAEKWIYETANFINKKEKTLILSVSPQISNFYSRLVLKRNYDSRVQNLQNVNLKSLSLKHFIPLNSSYFEIRKRFKDARKIYVRYEVLEITILLYFGGFKSLKKAILGIHSTLLYDFPSSFFEHFHNIVYSSFLSKFFLKNAKIVHVITNRNLNLLRNKFKLTNIEYIPTSIDVKVSARPRKKNTNELQVLFVGELLKRKGVDILLEVIKKSPNHFKFKIAGNGLMEKEVRVVCKEYPNCEYFGFLQKEELQKLYRESDVLFLPSRAEGFPLVFHEAMANGLMIVDSPQSTVGLPKMIERTTQNSKPLSFVKELEACYLKKTKASKIVEYYNKNLSAARVQKDLLRVVFN